MNMKKALAAGVAATLAVTSLAAYASADSLVSTIVDAAGNTKTFNMINSIGVYKLAGAINQDKYGGGLNLGEKFYLTDDEWTNGVRLINRENTDALIAAYVAQADALAEVEDAEAKLNGYFDAETKAIGGFHNVAADFYASKKDADKAYKEAQEATEKAKEALDKALEKYATDNTVDVATPQTAYTTALATEKTAKELSEAYAAIEAGTATDAQKATTAGTTLGGDNATSWADLFDELAEALEDYAAATTEVAAQETIADAKFTNIPGSADQYSKTDYVDYLEIKVPASVALVKAPALSFAVEGVYGTRTAGRATQNYDLVRVADDDTKVNGVTTEYAYRFYMYGNVAPTNGFQPRNYLEITKINLVSSDFGTLENDTTANGKKVKLTYLTEAEYNEIGTDHKSSENDTVKNLGLTTGKTLEVIPGVGAFKITKEFELASDTVKNDGVLSTTKDNNLFDQFEMIINDVNGSKWTYVENSKEVRQFPAFIPMTTGNTNEIRRQQVWLLSKTGAHASETVAVTSTGIRETTTDAGNQTYDGSYYYGTMPNFFAGLASQVADFFNKWDQGTITFKLAYSHAASTASTWTTGGVPSTEVGIKTLLQGMSTNDIALFFNYASTTGSLQAVTKIDADAGEIVFDISDILDALDGRTIGTVQDIYYGLNKGLDKYADGIPNGLFISEVKLERKEADVAAETATEDATDEVENDAADVEVPDEEPEVISDDEDIAAEDDTETEAEDEDSDVAVDDEDVAAEDEDDFAEDDTSDEPVDIDDDVADDDAAADDTADDTYVEPADDETATIDDTVAPAADDVAGEDVTPTTVTPVVAEADENPGTGVALAVVPAALAAAAIVISKKRK